MANEIVKVNPRATDAELRSRYASMIISALIGLGEDAAPCGSGVINLPCIDVNGEDSAIEISIKVPKGARKEGGGFEGYDYAEARTNYLDEVAKKAEEEEEKARKKATKIAKDEAARAAKEEAKAKKEAASAKTDI